MSPRLWSVRTFVAVWSALIPAFTPALGDAGDAARRVPADSLAYVGWSEFLGAEEGSLLDLLPTVAGIFHADPKVATVLAQLGEIGRIALTHSGGVALLNSNPESDAEPQPGLIAIVKPGGDADRLMQALTTLVETTQDSPIGSVTVGQHEFRVVGDAEESTVLWGKVGDEVILVGGEHAVALYRARVAEVSETLAADPVFTACRQKLGQESPTVCAFVNANRVIGMIRQAAQAEAPDPALVEKTLREVGLSSIQAVYAQASGSELGTHLQAFVKTDGSRNGILKIWDNPPLDEETLRLIPRDASGAAVCNLDVVALWGEAHRIVEALDPNAALAVDGALAGFSAILGISPTEQVLPALGDTWVIFDAPDHGGFLFTGMVLVAEVKDRAALQGAFEALLRVLTPLAMQAKMRPVTGKTERDGHTIHYLMLAGWPSPIVPAACFIDDRVVFGFSPQAVAVAANQVDPGTRGDSILSHPDVVAARKLLPAGLQSFYYADGKAAERANYPLGLLFGTALASMGAPDVSDPGLLPTLPEALADVHSGVGGWAADDDGLLYTSFGNVVPLALPGNQMTAVAVVALLISILLPSLARARELAKRAVSVSNLRGIGQGCFIYANDHDGSFPANLGVLTDEGMATDGMLNSPRDEADRVSYVYIAGQGETNDPRNVLAYERIIGDEGTSVLFLDGHAEWMKLEPFKQALLETYQRLGRESEMPEELRD